MASGTWGTANPNAAFVNHNHCTSDLVEFEPLDGSTSKSQVIVETLFIRSQENHSSVSAGRKEPKVGEFLVRRNEPPSLCLYTFPKIVVRHAAPALIEQSYGIVSVGIEQISNLSG